MKNLLLTVLGVVLFFTLHAQHNDLLWVSQLSGSGQSVPVSVVEDASGNLYIIGIYNNTISQDTFSLTAVGGQDIYIAKYNGQGQLLWLKGIGGSQAENAAGIALSQNGNTFYVGGQFLSNDCNFGGTTLATSGGNDVFLAKYNTSDGSLVWTIKAAYGVTQQFGGNLTVDASENVIQIGKYTNSVTFYGGILSFISPYTGIQQNYISKFDSNGNLIWAKTFKGNNSNNNIRSVSYDNTSYYFSGLYADSLYLEVDTVVSTSSTRDMMLFRTDTSGNVQWVRSIKGTGEDYLIRHFTDYSSFQYLSGYYDSPSLTIDSTATQVSTKTCVNHGSNDIFTACYSYDGTLTWVNSYGSGGDDQATGVYANADHAIFTGSYTGNISFSSFSLTNSATDAFMLETDRNGNVLGVNKAWGTGNDFCENGKINANNANLFVGPFYSATLYINNKTLTNPSPSTRDMFVAKFGKINLTFVNIPNVCYGDSSGSIDLTVSGNGTGPYTYAWTGPGGFTSTSEDITLLKAGWYKVTVTDALGAAKNDSSYISEGTAMALVFNVQNTSCFGVNDGSINLTVTGGASPYSYSWSNGSNTEDIIGLAPGWYSVTVLDANNCSKNDSVKINTPAALNVSGIVTPPTCVPSHDGAIDITVTGGTPAYSYLWSNGQVTEDLSGLDVNSYTVTITDGNGCTIAKTFNVVNPLAPSISAIIEAPSCVPGNDGSIDIIVSGGTMPYTYNWNDGNSLEDRINLTAGTYSITVTDDNSCSAIKTGMVVPINNPPSLSYLMQKPSCIPGNDGSIDLIVYNGTPPFAYNWSNSATTEDISSLSPGTYSVTVTDSKNCTATNTIILTVDSPMISLTSHGSYTFCEGDSLTIIATNGSDCTYEWYNGGSLIPGYTTPYYIAGSTGIYYAIATNSSGCKGYSDTANITVYPKPTVTINASSTDICAGNSVTLTASGGQTYLWNTGSSSNPLIIIPATTTIFSVTATDNNGCTNVANQPINVHDFPVITGTVTHETCAAGTGSIDITISHGDTPYSFLWSNLASSEDISNLVAGTYTVTVTSSSLCSSIFSAQVNPYVPLSASINTHTLVLFCSSSINGEVHVSASDGLAPYTYTWTNGVTTSYNNQIGVGTTYVTVTDQCNSSIIDSVSATSLPSMQASITSSQPATCSTSTNGYAMIMVSGGITPYSYVWSNSTSTTDIANDLSVGWHYVTVSDYCGSIIDSVQITSLPPMQASISFSAPVSCTGISNGIAVVSITDGVAPFSYIWTSGETTSTATQLPAGLNSVTVSDACGQVILSVNTGVQSPMSIDITTSSPASCPSISNGSATISVFDGSSPFTYLWTSGDTLATATHLTTGMNYVTVTDACTSLIDSVMIDVIPPVSAHITFFVNASCSNSQDGKATVNVQNGFPPYSYTWSNSASTGSVALDLSPGWNFVTVTDQCASSIDSVEIGYKTPLQAYISFNSPTDCISDSTGMAIITPMYGVQPYSYTWSFGTTTDSILQHLPTGSYFVTVSDFCGNTVVPFTINYKTPLNVTSQKENVLCFGNSNGSITLIPSNGVLPYSYHWSNASTDSIISHLSAGTYYYTVSDKCGNYTDSVIIRQPGSLSLSTIVTPVSFEGLSDGKIDLMVFGGTQPYSYLWSNSTETEDLSNISQGMYYVTITDDNGCTVSDSVNVESEGKHIEIYNAFTPNGDGKNDVWNIKYIQAFPNCSVLIYDQWGVKVFESTGYDKPWDGTKNDKQLPSATYYYVIDLKDGSKPFTGSVTLMK